MTGIRSILVTPKDGSPPSLVVQIVINGEAVLTFPGALVTPFRAHFQAIEAQHPTLVGDEPEVEVTHTLIKSPEGDPRLN